MLELNDKENKETNYLKSVLIIIMWVLLWQIVDLIIDNNIILVGPVEIIKTMWDNMTQPDFWKICMMSFGRITIGFLLSFILGFILAMAAYRIKIIEDIFNPIISLLKTVPMISFVIMLLIWVGNQALTIYLSFLVVLPLIYTNTLMGFKRVDKSMLEMARSFNFSKWKKFIFIYRPAFMPFVISGCKVALGMCWKSGVMAEVIATPKPSIGREMYIAQQYLQTTNLFAWTVVVIVLSTIFEKIFTKLLELLNKSGGILV